MTKGSFFHHFQEAKEDLALAAVDYWNTMTGGLFATAPISRCPIRATGRWRIDLRAEILQGNLPEFTCLLGTMVQETFETHPRARCLQRRHIVACAQTVAKFSPPPRQRYAAGC